MIIFHETLHKTLIFQKSLQKFTILHASKIVCFLSDFKRKVYTFRLFTIFEEKFPYPQKIFKNSS